MIRKLFVRSSVSVLLGLALVTGVTACSDSTGAPASDGGAADSADTKDGGKRPSDGEEVVEPTCYKDDPIDVRTVAYKPARLQTGSCTDKVFPVLKGVFAASNGNIVVADIKNALTTQSPRHARHASWARTVTRGRRSSSRRMAQIIPNYGGCFEVLSEKASCSKPCSSSWPASARRAPRAPMPSMARLALTER